ncbi:MAG: hypothetical protein H6Q58_1524 [Firmicutes bacterium]|nr:hypothetical protein [Bacillota bacterium]
MSSINLYPNGFLVKRIDSEYAATFGQYKGVEGDCFPINEHFSPKNVSLEESKYLSDFLSKNVMLNDFDNSYADVCPNIYFIKRYIKACKAEGIGVQVIYCKTQKKFPECEINTSSDSFRFLGYDLAYPGGSYYSCVFNDSKWISEMARFHLNKYGLFNSESEMLEFIRLRNELEKANPHSTSEPGEFIIYQLWEYKDI